MRPGVRLDSSGGRVVPRIVHSGVETQDGIAVLRRLTVHGLRVLVVLEAEGVPAAVGGPNAGREGAYEVEHSVVICLDGGALRVGEKDRRAVLLLVLTADSLLLCPCLRRSLLRTVIGDVHRAHSRAANEDDEQEDCGKGRRPVLSYEFPYLTYYSNVESGALSGDVFTPRKFDWKEFDVEEFANGYIRFENNMTVTFKISWALNQPNQQTISLCGDRGGLLLTDDSMKLVTTQGRYQADLMPRIFEDKYEKLSSFYGHIHVFEKALKVLDGEMTMEEYPIKKEEVLNVVSIIEAFYKSDKLGREVTFAELEK